MIIVSLTIVIILLQAKTTTSNTSKSQNGQSQNTHLERRYVESAKVLSELSEQVSLKQSKPKLSITLNNLLINNDKKFIKASFKEKISKLSETFDIFILLLGAKDEETLNRSILETFRDFVSPHKLLLCNTKEGLIAMIRQLKPRFHFENNDFIIERLSQHLNQILSLRELQNEILENSKINSKWNTLLEHNIEFYDSFEEMCVRATQLMKFN